MNATTPWFERIDAALASAKGISAEFQTSYQDVTSCNQAYHDHNGQPVVISGLIIERKNPYRYDEESLPFFNGKFADGRVLVCGFEELFSHDDRIIELMDAVNSGFHISREMGYLGPEDLDANGKDKEKLEFSEKVKYLKLGVYQNFNTPPEYRT